jgi:hypothetical protein
MNFIQKCMQTLLAVLLQSLQQKLQNKEKKISRKTEDAAEFCRRGFIFSFRSDIIGIYRRNVIIFNRNIYITCSNAVHAA